MEKIYVSQEGFQKLKGELAEKKSRTRVVAGNIEHARSFGDLRENGDYHAAKEEQAMLHAHIRDLEDKIARSVVVDQQQMDASKALLGATVRALNKKTNKEVRYVLVSPVEMDVEQGRISVKSPIGQAFLGREVGETVVAKVPAGEIPFDILEISR